MPRNILLGLSLVMCLSACTAVRESRVNPFNWFGRSEAVEAGAEAEVNPLIPQTAGLFQRNRERRLAIDPTSPITVISDLRVERVPGGAIIRATGQDPRLGTYNVALVPTNEDESPVDGVLTYSLRRQQPAAATPTGTNPQREVTAARRVTDQTLAGVRVIRVEGVENARVVRR